MDIEFRNLIFRKIIIRFIVDINEKFEIIFNEIILLKKNKEMKINEHFKHIEKFIHNLKDDINKKFEDNLKIINELKDKIEKNRIYLKKNNEIINILKDEIFNLNNI